MKYCPGCQQVLNVTEFYIDMSRRDERSQYCRECKRARNRAVFAKWYSKPGNAEKQVANAIANRRNRRRMKQASINA